MGHLSNDELVIEVWKYRMVPLATDPDAFSQDVSVGFQVGCDMNDQFDWNGEISSF